MAARPDVFQGEIYTYSPETKFGSIGVRINGIKNYYRFSVDGGVVARKIPGDVWYRKNRDKPVQEKRVPEAGMMVICSLRRMESGNLDVEYWAIVDKAIISPQTAIDPVHPAATERPVIPVETVEPEHKPLLQTFTVRECHEDSDPSKGKILKSGTEADMIALFWAKTPARDCVRALVSSDGTILAEAVYEKRKGLSRAQA